MSFTQISRVVRLMAFLLLGLTLHLSAKVNSQTVTYSGTDVPLKQLFSVIREQTGVAVFYDEALLQHTTPVDVQATAAPLLTFLQQILHDQPLAYTIKGETIFIHAKEKKNNDEVQVKKGPPVTGVIKDADGNPLEGVNIMIKGTKRGTTTDAKGMFTLDANEGEILLITSVGFADQQVKVGSNKAITVSLAKEEESLQEITINKGYYTEKQKYSVSNVGRVTSKDIEKQPANNPLMALQGRVPGLFITQNTGVPGGGVTVRIQGQNSILNGSNPLYVIDGVPYPTTFIGTGGINAILGNSEEVRDGTPADGGNALRLVNPADIESIDVLKDADATAIYGSRAANGAILITTKKGRAGKLGFQADVQRGFGHVGKKLDMLNTQQYLEMRREAYYNDSLANPTLFVSPTELEAPDLFLWDQNKYTDWQKVLIGNSAEYTNVTAGLQGGNANTKFLLSSTYHKETTVFPGDFNDRKVSLHFNVNSASLNEKFKVQISGSYLSDVNQLPMRDLVTSIWLSPNAPNAFKSDGTVNWAPNFLGNSSWVNPYADALLRTYEDRSFNLLGSLNISYEILPGLSLKSGFGYNQLQSDIVSTSPLGSELPEYRAFIPRSAIYGTRAMHSFQAEPQLSYERIFYKANISILLGGTLQQTDANTQNTYASGFNSDLVLKNITSATSFTPFGVSSSIYKYNALFARINYIHSQKFVVNLTARRDGSSRFGSANLFHNFWSAGGGYIFSEENFFKEYCKLLNFGKLRFSYGTTGSDQISDYQFLNLYNSSSPFGAFVPYQGTAGLSPAGITNPHVQWEETKKIQAGIDLAVMQDRLALNVTYTRNRSSNQLVRYSLPSIVGVSDVALNLPAIVQNTGWEFSFNSTNIEASQIRWTTSVNLTLPRNKLVDYPGLQTSSYSGTYIIGQPLSINKLYHFLGVDPATGVYLVADVEGKPTIAPNYSKDRTVVSSSLPRFYGGLQNSLDFKRFQLNFLFQFVKQKGTDYGKLANGSLPPGIFDLFNGSNQLVAVLDRWQKPGDNAIVGRYSATFSPTFYNASVSDHLFTDASFIRLKTLSLSYEMPSRWSQKVHLQNCKLYVNAQNLLTFTKFKGLDPENQSYSSLPPLRVITGGIQLSL